MYSELKNRDISPHRIATSHPTVGAASGHFRYKDLLWSIICVWVVGMIASLLAFRTFSLSTPPLYIEYAKMCSIGFGITSVISVLLGRMTLGKLWSSPACLVFSAAVAVMFIGIAINMAGYTASFGGSWSSPALKPDDVSGICYQVARELADGCTPEFYQSRGYPTLLMWMFGLFGKGILAPLLLNALAMTLTIALSGRVAVMLCSGGDAKRRAWTAMLLCALIPNIIFYGTILTKEALSTCGISLAALLLADLYHGKARVSTLLPAAVGMLLITLTRSQLSYAVALLSVLCFLHSWLRRTGTLAGRTNSIIAALLLCVSSLLAGQCFKPGPTYQLLLSENAEYNNSVMMDFESVQEYAGLIGNYYEKSPINRLAYLPVASAVQYFPPFPWNYTRDLSTAHFVPYARLSVLWYFVGGLVLAYFALCIYRRQASGSLQLWAIGALLCYLSVAYLSAGSVARYYLPFTSLCIPLALQVLLNIRHQVISHKIATVYASTYGVLICIGLAIAYNFLKM